MSKSRKNVTVERDADGIYRVTGKSGRISLYLDADLWRDLGLKPLRCLQKAVIDLQVSGLPKRRKKK